MIYPVLPTGEMPVYLGELRQGGTFGCLGLSGWARYEVVRSVKIVSSLLGYDDTTFQEFAKE